MSRSFVIFLLHIVPVFSKRLVYFRHIIVDPLPISMTLFMDNPKQIEKNQLLVFTKRCFSRIIITSKINKDSLVHSLSICKITFILSRWNVPQGFSIKRVHLGSTTKLGPTRWVITARIYTQLFRNKQEFKKLGNMTIIFFFLTSIVGMEPMTFWCMLKECVCVCVYVGMYVSVSVTDTEIYILSLHLW